MHSEFTRLEQKQFLGWCRNQDSNPGPDDYKSTALPTELLRHTVPKTYRQSYYVLIKEQGQIENPLNSYCYAARAYNYKSTALPTELLRHTLSKLQDKIV